MSQGLVLIVEDNEKNRKLIRDLLQAKGYQTIDSDSAEEDKACPRKKPGSHPDGHPTAGRRRHYGNEAA